jgi:hypothetical protein
LYFALFNLIYLLSFSHYVIAHIRFFSSVSINFFKDQTFTKAVTNIVPARNQSTSIGSSEAHTTKLPHAASNQGQQQNNQRQQTKSKPKTRASKTDPRHSAPKSHVAEVGTQCSWQSVDSNSSRRIPQFHCPIPTPLPQTHIWLQLICNSHNGEDESDG